MILTSLIVVSLVASGCGSGMGEGIAKETVDFLRARGVEIADPDPVSDVGIVSDGVLEAAWFSVQDNHRLVTRELVGTDMRMQAMSGPGSEELGFRPLDHPIVYVAQWWYRDAPIGPAQVRTVAIFDGGDATVVGVWDIQRP